MMKEAVLRMLRCQMCVQRRNLVQPVNLPTLLGRAVPVTLCRACGAMRHSCLPYTCYEVACIQQPETMACSKNIVKAVDCCKMRTPRQHTMAADTLLLAAVSVGRHTDHDRWQCAALRCSPPSNALRARTGSIACPGAGVCFSAATAMRWA